MQLESELRRSQTQYTRERSRSKEEDSLCEDNWNNQGQDIEQLFERRVTGNSGQQQEQQRLKRSQTFQMKDRLVDYNNSDDSMNFLVEPSRRISIMQSSTYSTAARRRLSGRGPQVVRSSLKSISLFSNKKMVMSFVNKSKNQKLFKNAARQNNTMV